MATMDREFLEYSALDSACTLEIHNAIWGDVTGGGYDPAYQMTIDLFPVLQFMQTKGIRVSHEEMAITKQDILRQAADKQKELNEICGRELNVNSPKDCQRYFYIEKGIPPYYNDGSVTTDDSAMQRIARGTAARRGLKEAKLVQDIRGLRKLHGTYLDIEFDADQRIRCSYNPRGTKFGRLSSSQTVFGTGTNLQNLPQEFKRFLIADPGYVLWEVDKRQAEWVVVAYLTGDANMISIVETGKDGHIHTAALMMSTTTGLPYDACWQVIEKEAKLVGGANDPDYIAEVRASNELIASMAKYMPRTMSCRQRGKKSNHGLNYDEGYRRYALINEIEESEGKKDVELYHTVYPGIRIWYDFVKRQLQKTRSLTNCFGRKVTFMGQWDDTLWKAAYSMLPQSTVVDSLNMGMAKVYGDPFITAMNQCNIDVLAQVHDSILMQVPITIMQDLVKFQNVIDKVYDYVSPEITYNGRTFKLNTDSKIGLNWGGAHPERNPLGMRDMHDAAHGIELLKGMLNTGV